MKKILAFAAFLSIICCSCGQANGDNSNVTSESSLDSSETDVPVTTTACITTATTTTKKTEPTTVAAESPTYIGGIRQQYDEAKREHTILWQFYDKQKNPMASEAMITIKIVNDDGEEVFDDVFDIKSSDYSVWENNLTGKSQLMGSITIKDDDIAEGSNKRGQISIKAFVNNGGFEEQTISISELPEKGFEILLPELPATSNEYNWHDELESTMTVTDISYEYDWSLKIHVTAQMTYNINGNDSRDYGRVGYKITDGSGMVIKSGDILYDRLSVGESQVDDIYVSDAKPGDTLVLEILDAS